jgi:hypothetical protein
MTAYLFHPHSWVGFTENDALINYKLRSKITSTLWQFDPKSISFLADLIIEEERQKETNSSVKEQLLMWTTATTIVGQRYAFENR